MALVVRRADASDDTSTTALLPKISGLFAGEDIDPASPCYIAAADGKVYMCDGTAANEKAVVAGWNARSNVKAGQPVTLYAGINAIFSYSQGLLTPGQKLYLATTKGRLDTVAQTGDNVGVAQAIDTYDIRATRII
jgi:hypothetical protein